MAQPNGAPPEQWERRRPENDALRRLVAEFKGELESLTDEVNSISHALKLQQESAVTHKGLMVWAGGFAGAVILAVWLLLGEYKTAVRSDLAALREDNRETRLDVKALYMSQPKRKRQDRLEMLGEEMP